MTTKSLFGEWAEKRSDVITEKNYSSIDDFTNISESFGETENVEELNAELTEVGQLWRIASGEEEGYFYPATGHFNFTQLEERLAALETGNLSHPEYFSCKVFPRGMAAIATTLETIGSGSDGLFIRGTVMYPSTKELLKDNGTGRNMVGSLPGIEIDLTNPENLDKKLVELKQSDIDVLGIVLEPVANPTLDYTDIRQTSEVAHRYDVPVIVDNTFLSPFLLEPIRMGADIVMHSLTKYYNGQGDLLGGAVIAPNEFIKHLQDYRKHKGYTMSPHDAFRLAQRVGGIGERMQLHCQNAKIMAEELSKIENINVKYKNLGDETRNGHAGGVLSFVFEGDNDIAFERSRKFTEYLCNNPGIVKQAVSFAEEKTLVLPWGGQIRDPKWLNDGKVPLGLVRVGVGREKDIYEVIDYLKKGIQKSL